MQKKATKEIAEGGGLSAIRKKVESCNGTVSIRLFPECSLIIKISEKEEPV